MRSIFLTILLSIFVLTNTNAQSNESISKGVKLINETQYRTAIGYFKQLPQSDESEYQLGKIYLILQKNDSAIFHFGNVAKVNPKSVYALIANGVVELQKQNQKGFEENITKAAKQSKKNAYVLSEIARICISGVEKNFDQAIQIIEKGKETFAKSPLLYDALGDVELARKEYGKALSAYEWAVQYDNTNALIYRKIATIQGSSRDYKNAVISFEKSLNLDANQVMVYKYFSDLQFLYGKFDQSLNLYQTYLSKCTPTIEEKERYSLILFFNKKYDEAAKEMDFVMKENPKSAVLYRIRGYIAYETGDYNKGVELMKKFFEIQNPDKVLTSDYIYYGRLNAKVKKTDEAIFNLKKAISLDNTQNDLIEELALIYSKSNQHENAINSYNMMIKNGYNKINGLFQIGKEYYYIGTSLKTIADSIGKGGVVAPQRAQSILAFKAADSTFTELTKLNPKFAGGFIWKARALSNLDLESTLGLAKEPYLNAVALMEPDSQNNKKLLIECYRYMASFNYICFERENKKNQAAAKECKSIAIKYFEKIAELDPKDAEVKNTITMLKK